MWFGRGARSRVVAGASAAAVGATAAWWGVSSGWFGSADSEIVCVDETFSQADAALIAEHCGTDVEVTSERTSYDTVYVQADGHMRMDTSIAAVRAKVDGQWREPDPTVVPGPSAFTVAAAVAPMEFAADEDSPLAKIERDGHWMTLDVPFDLPEPVQVGASQLEYREVLPGVDLVVTVHEDGTGYSEVFRVDSPQAVADPRFEELSFVLGFSDGLSAVEVDGGLEITDTAGERVFASPMPLMWDSREAPVRLGAAQGVAEQASWPTSSDEWAEADPRAQAPIGVEKVAAMPVRLEGEQLFMTPDRALLEDPDTVWPVYIDPSVSAGRHEWTSIRSDGWSDYMYTGDQGMGRCGTTGYPMYCSKVFTRRSIWEFNGLGRVGAVDASQVISATFRVYGVHSYSCTGYPVQFWSTGGVTSSSSWPHAWGTLTQTQSLAHKASCSNARWIEFDATALARGVANANHSTLTVGLKAENESSSTGWKRYRYDATLSVTYNQPPNLPTDAEVSVADTQTYPCATGDDRPYVRSSTPTLGARLSDPDSGDTVTGLFEVYEGATRLWYAFSGAQSAGGAHHSRQVGVALTDGHTYRWQIRGKDNRGTYGPVRSCEFTVDTTAPQAPTVTAGGEVAYLDDGQPYGGLGQSGEFTFASESSDVVGYNYGFDDTAMGENVAEASPTLSFTPGEDGGLGEGLGAGPHTLFVQSVDRAGNVSARTDYTFVVGFASMDGAWSLDDGSGDTAQDVAGELGWSTEAHPFTLGSTVAWGDGPLGARAGVADDGALEFTGGTADSDVGTTGGPVVDTAASFTVMATVRLDETADVATAVSQDGQNASGFELGYREGAGCPDGSTGCWAFARASGDDPGASMTVVSGDAPVETGQWVHLTGVYDAAQGELSLYTCEVAASTATAAQDPHGGPPVADPHLVHAYGDLTIGRGRADSSGAHGWDGSIADVHVWAGVVDEATVRAACQSPR